MNIGYICTNFNNSSFTREAIRSFFLGTGPGSIAVVVDNQSNTKDKDELRLLECEWPRLKVIYSLDNLGYFRGLNAGLRNIAELADDVMPVVVGNNDLIFPSDFGAQMENCSSVFQSYPVTSPDIVTPDGTHQNPHVIRRISFFRSLMYRAYYSNYHAARVIAWGAHRTRRVTGRKDEREWPVRRRISQGHGSCYILGPKFFANYAQLWAPTFLFAEEFFLSLQLAERGDGVFYEPAVRVTHHSHAATGQAPRRKMWEYARAAHRIQLEFHRRVAEGPFAADHSSSKSIFRI